MEKKIYKKESTTYAVGIDIGTTTVSAVVYDIKNKTQIKSYSTFHNSYVICEEYSEQSVEKIIEVASSILYQILDSYKNIISIGITGQMHGILYVDKNGNSISNLINWQDKRGDKILENFKTPCQQIFDITGEKAYTGYGIVTHFYNHEKSITPPNVSKIVTIMDYFAMKICGLSETVMHTSVASSLGLFDNKNHQFKYEKISSLGIDTSILPCVTDKSVIIGKCRGIPVSIPIGDNQASFLGAVKENENSMLVNIGTGSQVSAVCSYFESDDDIELRPFIEGKYLACGSALSGGSAYALLEGFFREYAKESGINDTPQYEIMNKLAYECYKKGEKGLVVDTSFSGKRSNPHHRGAILDIGKESFTPSNLILGVIRGMCYELYELYDKFPIKKSCMIASGGAVEKIPILKAILSDTFCMDVSQSNIKEEAAEGAALFSLLAIKNISCKE